MIELSLSVRVATPADAPALSAFATRTFREAFSANVSPGAMDSYLLESFAPEKTQSELSDPANVFLIAETPGGFAGYAKLFWGVTLPEVRGKNPVKLWRLYTAREAQGQGVGALLLFHAAHTAQSRGGGTLWLTVNTGNIGAVRFYERHGFRQTGFTAFNLGGEIQSDLVMERAL